jgi:Rrf2 family transcriptional regulator, iron-sulfur cluster assembly transcription factor
MMELTRKGEYAIRGILYLARQPRGKVSLVGEIAQASEVPKTFLAKILRDFVKVGLATSSRGTGGGFSLSRPADRITLREVVEAVEGPIRPNRCLMGTGTCERDGTCRVHPVWKKVRDQIVTVLDGVTIAELAQEQNEDMMK